MTAPGNYTLNQTMIRNFPGPFPGSVSSFMEVEPYSTRWEDRPHLPEPSEFVENLLPSGALAFIYAASGLGKTRVALELANAVANGTPFKGRRTNQTGVLYIDYESGMRLLQKYGREIDLKGLIEPVLDLPAHQLQAEIRQAAAAGYRFVIFDALSGIVGQSDIEGAMNSTGAIEKILNPLSRMAHSLGVTIVMLHHTNKGGVEFDGNQRIRAIADLFFKLSLYPSTQTMKLVEDKHRYHTEDLEWDASDHPKFRKSSSVRTPEAEAEPGSDPDEERYAWVIARLASGPLPLPTLRSEFSAQFGVQARTMLRLLTKYEGKAEVEQRRGGKGKPTLVSLRTPVLI